MSLGANPGSGTSTGLTLGAKRDGTTFERFALDLDEHDRAPGIVNDAWQMHLQTAQNYWEQLGQMIAERPMAQGVDAKNMASMADAWKATLESYEKIFGTKPPMDIWGQGPAAENPWMQAMNTWKKMFGMG